MKKLIYYLNITHVTHNTIQFATTCIFIRQSIMFVQLGVWLEKASKNGFQYLEGISTSDSFNKQHNNNNNKTREIFD